MWHTNCGDRTLDGAEARLFAEALWDFICELEVDEGDFDVGAVKSGVQFSKFNTTVQVTTNDMVRWKMFLSSMSIVLFSRSRLMMFSHCYEMNSA